MLYYMMPMKVTVCFDRVKVVVPCGDGDILVDELIKKAIIRFKKATGKPNDYWVDVHNLRTCNDGGILDPDDQLNDVVDDREQLIADYQEQGGPSLYNPHNGDGASASSTGTASPEHFQGLDPSAGSDSSTEYHPHNRHDVVVTPKDLSEGPGLTVRRGSEPVLNVIDDEKSTSFGIQKNNNDKNKVHNESEPNHDHTSGKDTFGQEKNNNNIAKNPFNRFARDSWRQSLGNQPEMYKWLEAQERQQDKYKQMERKEPVGGASTDPENPENVQRAVEPASNPAHPPGSIMISLNNDGGPLGIHVIPEYDDTGRELGLLVQGVEPGGRVSSDGRLRVDDRIIEINNITLIGVTFSKAQEIFRNAMTTDEIKLRIIKRKAPPLPKHPPPTLPKPKGHTPVKPSPLTLPSKLDIPGPVSPITPDQTSTPAANSPEGPGFHNGADIKSPRTPRALIDVQPIKPGPPIKPPPLSPTKRAPPAVPTRHPSTTLTKEQSDSSLKDIIAPTNTKKIGKKIEIQLTKGALGLGFSVTTRDNPAGGVSPIYIKNILPKGAAIIDGRLKAGDRLLEVNGEDMTGKTQAEAVALLRNIKNGADVEIVVSRQETYEEKFAVPRELKTDDDQKQNVFPQPKEKSGDDGSLAIMKNKEIISLDIPLNESGSAGLGVSVKGKTMTTEEGTKDLGIFIKSVIHGGAASKDRRLFINDQLLEVNSEKLMGLPNTDAMETLRKAMIFDGPIPGCIHLVIARKIGAPSPSPFEQSTFFNQNDSSELIPKSESELNDSNEIIVGAVSDKKVTNIKTVEKSPDILPKGDNSADFDDLDSNTPIKSILDQLKTGNGLRNESYTRATHDSFNDSANIFSSGFTPHKKAEKYVVPSSDQVMVVEDDNNEVSSNNHRTRPHSTIGFMRSSPTPSSSSEDLHQQPPPWLQEQDWNRHASTTSEEMSPGIDPAITFNREGFGRQSMSEKRRGHLDPRGSEFYQRVKSNREGNKDGSRRAASFHVSGLDMQQLGCMQGYYAGKHGKSPLIRVGSAESIISRSSKIGSNQGQQLPQHGKRFMFNFKPDPPSSNLKRFNSLENIAVSVANEQDSHDKSNDADEEDEQEEEDKSFPKFRIMRGRGTNESFRAAVDRSYDVNSSEHSTMDPCNNDDEQRHSNKTEGDVLTSSGGFTVQGQVEEESSESGSFGQGARTNSARSSMSSEPNEEHGHKKHTSKKGKDKKSGILKGIFKLGKHKKSHDEPMIKIEVHDEKKDEKSLYPEHDVIDTAGQRSLNTTTGQRSDQQLRQDQNRWLQENQYMSDNSSRQPVGNYNDQMNSKNMQQSQTNTDQFIKDPKSMTRAEWIQYLRSKHQQQHRERQGHYPLEDREETYEKQIQELEKRLFGQSTVPSNEHDHQGPKYRQDDDYPHRPSSRPSEAYMSRPSSRPSEPYMSRPSSRPSEDYSSRPSSRPSEDYMSRPSSRPSEDYMPRPSSRPSEDYLNRPRQADGCTQNEATGSNDVFMLGQRSRSSSRQQYERPGSRTGNYVDQPIQYYSQNTDFGYPRQQQIIHQRQHSDQDLISQRHFSAQDYSGRHFSSRGPTPVDDFYNRRIPARSQTPVEQWSGRDPQYQNRQLYGRQEPPPGGGYYGDNLFTYKDPVYPAVAGKRPVQSLSQPGSAKV